MAASLVFLLREVSWWIGQRHDWRLKGLVKQIGPVYDLYRVFLGPRIQALVRCRTVNHDLTLGMVC